ncbi:hypothetical protein [Raoultella planticola]|nr:hypothetical protein [Raoultella planticola]HED2622455.1 hypothetical protein [Raoultella planticola]
MLATAGQQIFHGVLGICQIHADVGHGSLGEGTFSGAGSAERANVA